MDGRGPPQHTPILSPWDTESREEKGFFPLQTQSESSWYDKSLMRSAACSITGRTWRPWNPELMNRAWPCFSTTYHKPSDKPAEKSSCPQANCVMVMWCSLFEGRNWERLALSAEEKNQLGDLQDTVRLKLHGDQTVLNWQTDKQNDSRQKPNR